MNQESEEAIIILHGWGLSGNTYAKLIKLFKKEGCPVFAPDLPGFGSEPLQKPSMKLDDYVTFVHDFISKHKMQKVILIGHSFGGRVAIKYVWEYPHDVSKLILTGVPIIRKKSLIKQIAYASAVLGGKVFSFFPKKPKEFFRKTLYFAIGEWGYYKSGPLKQVFKNIIGEDLVCYIQKIKTPTLLIWGKDDCIVPAKTIEKIKNYIPHAKVIIVSKTEHKFPYENAAVFFEKVLPFIK